MLVVQLLQMFEREVHTPRSLHEKAIRKSCLHASQWARAKPSARSDLCLSVQSSLWADLPDCRMRAECPV